MQGRGKREFQGTVLIADDHQVFRVGLMQLLGRHLNVKHFIEAECFADALAHFREQNPALTIVDLRMPGLSGPKDLACLRVLRPETFVVVLSASEAREDILEALAAGVQGYIVKSQHTDQLIDKLRYILSGEIYVPSILAHLGYAAACAANADHVNKTADKSLSGRQLQVLNGLVEGKSNKEIAQALNVAEGTVKMHLVALFRVLGATNRAHAAALGKKLIV